MSLAPHGFVPPSFWRSQGGTDHLRALRSRATKTFAQIPSADPSSVAITVKPDSGDDDAPSSAATTGNASKCQPSESFGAQARTASFWAITLWYTFHLALLVYYFFSAVFHRPGAANFSEAAGWLGNGLPGLMGPLAGIFIHRVGFRASLLVTNAAAAGMLLLLIPGAGGWMDLTSLLLFCVHRTLIFAIFFTYIPVRFGGENYGKLVGLANVVSGSAGLFTGPAMETMLAPGNMLVFAGASALSSLAAVAM